MAGIKLRLDQGIEGKTLVNGVAANIYGISTDGKLGSRLVQKLVLPVGSQDFSDIPLDPGNYLVEAIMPSGDVISEMVSFEEGENPPEVVLQTEGSPHEWMIWQHFMGNVESRGKAYETRLSQVPDTPPLPPAAQPQAMGDMAFLVESAPATPIQPQPPATMQASIFTVTSRLKSGSGILDPISLDPLMRTVAEVFNSSEKPEPWHTAADVLNDHWQGELALTDAYVHQSVEDELYQRYDLSGDMFLNISPSGGAFDYRDEVFDRCYFVANGDGAAALCVLPVPWQQTDYGEEAHVEILVDKASISRSVEKERGGFQESPRISVVVQDRRIGSLIGYLGQGDIASAVTVLQNAQELLYGKVTNPMAAAAGGYILINAQRAREELDDPQVWFHWVLNLMNWFPWLPDGAIQHGWLMLLNGENDEDNIAEARLSFLEGYRRGIPLYSIGVKMLYEGLTLFASNARSERQTDDEIETALAVVRKLALRTNMELPFTVIRLF